MFELCSVHSSQQLIYLFIPRFIKKYYNWLVSEVMELIGVDGAANL